MCVGKRQRAMKRTLSASVRLGGEQREQLRDAQDEPRRKGITGVLTRPCSHIRMMLAEAFTSAVEIVGGVDMHLIFHHLLHG